MKWLLFIAFTFTIYTALTLLNNFCKKYGFYISEMSIGAIGGILCATFFNILCGMNNISFRRKEKVIVEWATYESLLKARYNDSKELEKLDTQLKKAERILIEISNIGKKQAYKDNPWLKRLVESYFEEDVI